MAQEERSSEQVLGLLKFKLGEGSTPLLPSPSHWPVTWALPRACLFVARKSIPTHPIHDIPLGCYNATESLECEAWQ